MMGAGSDWDVTPNNSEPISDEERERLIEIAKDMGRRAGEQINKMLIEAYREIA
jgi:hypothetical protein